MLEISSGKIKYEFTETRDRVPGHVRGKQCFILTEGEALDEARRYFNRGNDSVCLKVFFTPLDGEMGSYYWGTPWRHYTQARTEEIGRISKLYEATKIQNILWMHGKAPRVYGICKIIHGDKIYPAQLVEYIEGDNPNTEWVRDEMSRLQKWMDKEYGVDVAHKDMVGPHDFIDGKIIDLQGFRFGKKYKEKIVEKIRTWGKYGKGFYQSVPSLGITPKPRNTENRIEAMGLDKLDFQGKDVLDLGCNGGVFCNYASSRGAKRVLGVDEKSIIRAARLLSTQEACYNVDYIAADLTKTEFSGPWDYTFFLSMNAHIGLPQWVVDNTKFLIFEENAMASKYKTDEWIERLKKDFKEVKLVGHTTDHNPKHPKAIIWASK